ncbi:MAG TPA: pyrroline-5-carboxylate reductase [Terriglobales bacterium]|nr:pyrroline-5-carboxylate reductase [Terriglobales bacterium]
MTTGKELRQEFSGKRLAVLGAGKIGTILLQALLRGNLISREHVMATVQHKDRAAALSKELKVSVGTNNVEAVTGSDIILICVKPQTVGQVLDEVRAVSRPEQLFISVAASVPTTYMERRLGASVPVLRAMPNTPAVIGCGMTAICKGLFANEKHVQTAHSLFGAVGKTVVVDERHMDAVTGLSASGPAFLYIILESLAEAGVKVGLPRELATLLAAQTMLGSAKVALETGHHPALLKDAVTTPAGCTIDGIMELEEGKLRVTLIKAVVKATQRAKELVFGSDSTASVM